MAPLSSVFSTTLHEITTIKLSELAARHATFNNTKTTVLDFLPSPNPNPSPHPPSSPSPSPTTTNRTARLTALAAGVAKCFNIQTDASGAVVGGSSPHARLEAELRLLARFVAQAAVDPSVSERLLKEWEGRLGGWLEMGARKFAFAEMYGELVREWVAAGEEGGKGGGEGDGKGAGGMLDVEVGEGQGFEDVGSAEKVEARMRWEESVFQPAGVDVVALEDYLGELFGVGCDEDDAKKRGFNALRAVRKAVGDAESALARPDNFNTNSLKWAITGLLSSDLLSDEKREVLKDFKGNDVILSEIADVLNMRVAALESWSWGSSVDVEQRRQISGVYKVHMHEDLLQAIFLQFLGVKWSVVFKRAFRNFRDHKGAWKAQRVTDVPKADKRKLEYYLGHLPPSRQSLHMKRRRLHRKSYFVSQLLGNEEENVNFVEGDQEAEFDDFAIDESPPPVRKQLASKPGRGKGLGMGGAMRHRRIIVDREDDSSDEQGDEDAAQDRQTPVELKQKILHILATEIAINTELRGELTAFHSVFQDWQHLLPHETALTVLKLFGVSAKWLGFFRAYLEAPLRFIDEDAPSAPRARCRGIPSSHALSDVFSEAVLFCLDFSVNEATSGTVLWRVAEDVWFWTTEYDTAVAAWSTVQTFASTTGTSLNMTKTGSAYVGDAPLSSTEPKRDLSLLPAGQIRWGFLILSPETGCFVIDQAMVDAHITKLRRLLLPATHRRPLSIFAFVQIWNSYAATFLPTNFGPPANSFGAAHVTSLLQTHERIQRSVFAGTTPSDGPASVATHLKHLLSTRFNAPDIPDGFLFFPPEQGGLGLTSPFLPLLHSRPAVMDSPAASAAQLAPAERAGFKAAWARFRADEVTPGGDEYRPAGGEEFLSFAEYVRHRDVLDLGAGGLWDNLMWPVGAQAGIPREECPGAVGEAVDALVGAGKAEGTEGPMQRKWEAMLPYWRWVAAIYGPGVVERFGGLEIVDPALLPMGMVGLLRDRRIVWSG